MQLQQSPHCKLGTISIDPETVRPVVKRRYNKGYDSEPFPGKNELKIVRLDEQISTPGSASVVNLEFNNTDIIPMYKRSHRKPHKRSYIVEDRKSFSNQAQSSKIRYQEAVKDNLQYFCKNTIQIGPCIRPLACQTQISDLYARRRLINIEKLSYPYREKRQCSAKQKYRSLLNKTSRTTSKPTEEREQRSMNRSYREMSVKNCKEGRHSSQTTPIFDTSYCLNNEARKELTALIPVRKPSNKKDYFVFGLSDRSNTAQNKIQLYRDLLWKVNYSNGLYVCTPNAINSNYKFFVGEGNNSNLIRGIMRRRYWWNQASSKNEEGINFLWTQLKINTFFSRQESGHQPQYFVVERVKTEHEKESSEHNMGAFEQEGTKRLFGRIDYRIWKRHLQKNEKTEKRITENTYQRRIKMYEKKRISRIDSSHSLKVHNHLQSNFYIGNKKALYYNLKRYLELKGHDPFDLLPLTFHIKRGVEDPEYHRFLQYYNNLEEEKRQKKTLRNIWIVKPGENTNRGNGITVCYSLDDIKHRLKGRERNGDGKLRTFILQKYIENPMLYNKRKFDIRHYILISCINGSFKGYWYEEGYVRTSSVEFSLKCTKDPLAHLTNDAIQKNTAQYGKFEKGNKLSYAELQKYLDVTYPSKKYNFEEQMIPQMKHFAAEAVRATYFALDGNRKMNNFQLLGLDFMIDEDFKPWLIEANTNPCLELCCPLLQRIVPSVIQNTFKLCIDPLFPPPENWPNNRKLFFGEDALNQNRYELIFDENSDGKEIEKLFAGKQKLDSMIGKIEQDNQTFENDGDIEWENEKL